MISSRQATEKYCLLRTTQYICEEEKHYALVRLGRQGAFKSTTVYYVRAGKGLRLQQNSFNLASDNPALLRVWHLKKVVQSPEVLLSVISGACNYSKILLWVTWTLLSPMSYYTAFRRSTDEYTRQCHQEETHNLASSENSNNLEP